jgi:ribosome recycling factor
MDKALEAARRSFASVRTGRASPAMVDRVVVDYYGAPTPLTSLAGVSAPDAGTVLIQPYDQGSVAVIEKAIMASDLGITPANDGRVIRLAVPPLTADRRKEMAKTVAKLGEDGKVAVRNVRKAAMKTVDAMLKAGTVSEDRHKALGKAVQDLTDAHVKEVDELVKAKQAELSKV